MSEIIIGTILGGSLIGVVVMYILMITLLIIKALNGEMKTDSRGIKNLRFQGYNSAWNKWVIQYV